MQFYQRLPMKVDGVNLQHYVAKNTESLKLEQKFNLLEWGQNIHTDLTISYISETVSIQFGSHFWVSVRKSEQLTKEAKLKAAKLCHKFLLVQHQALRFLCAINQENYLRFARKRLQYLENLIKREKRKRSDLEKKLRLAQIPTSQAISEQVDEELDTQLPQKRGNSLPQEKNPENIFTKKKVISRLP